MPGRLVPSLARLSFKNVHVCLGPSISRFAHIIERFLPHSIATWIEGLIVGYHHHSNTYVCSTIVAHALLKGGVMNEAAHPFARKTFYPKDLGEYKLNATDDFMPGVRLSNEYRIGAYSHLGADAAIEGDFLDQVLHRGDEL